MENNTLTLLGAQEAAKVLGISEHTLRKWVKEGTAPHVKMGSLLRFAPDQLEEIVNSRRVD